MSDRLHCEKTASLQVLLMHRRFEHVEREGFDAIADRELVALGKFLDRWHEPRQEPVVRLDRCAVRLEAAGGAT
jgi:hypothetical protein